MPEPVKLDFSKAVPIADDGAVKLDFSKAQPVEDTVTPMSAPPAKPGIFERWDKFTAPLTEIQKPDSSKKWSLGEAGKAVGNIGAGGLGILLHPLDTLAGIGGMITAPAEMATGTPFKKTVPGELLSLSRKIPTERLEAGIGQAGAMGGVGEVAGGVARAIPKVADMPGKIIRAGQEAVTRTSPSDVANIVRDTSAKNVEAVRDATDKNVAQDAARKLDLRKHFEKKQAANMSNEEASAQVSRKEAINRGIEKSDPKFHEDLAATEKEVNAKANEKYASLRRVLKDEKSGMYQPKDEDGHIQGEPVSVPQRLFDAADASMRGSDNAPTIVKDLGKRVQQGEVSLSYNDLQGYREEIGRELRKGTLAPDVFDAYKRMMPMIDDAMQEIAERKGMGRAQMDARNYYRQYAQTFLDKESPLRQAIHEGKSLKREAGSVIDSLRDKDAAVQALARYNPELARRANTLRGLQSEAASLPAKPGKVTPAPNLEPPKPPVEAKTTTLTPQILSDLKGVNVDKAAEGFRAPNRMASTFLGYDLMRNAFNALGNAADFKFGSAAKDLLKSVRDVGIRVGYSMGSGKMADLLERPAVRESLKQITDRDIAELKKLPPDQQAALGSELKALVDSAQKKGVKVSSPLSAWVGAVVGATAPKKTPGDLLRQNQQ